MKEANRQEEANRQAFPGRGADVLGYRYGGVLCDPTRRCVSIGYSCDSGEDTLSPNLASAMKFKAHCLQTKWRKANGLVEIREGQTNLVRSTAQDGSTALVPITCKSQLYAKSAEEAFLGAELLPKNHTAVPKQLRIHLPWEQLPTYEGEPLYLNKKVSWKNGHEILESKTTPVSPSCFEDILTKSSIPEVVSFEPVRDDFQYEVGQKVGVAIFSLEGATPLTAGAPNLSQAEVTDIFGPAGETRIYCGTIKAVGEHHIEHDINTFLGGRGALVFLLDKNQPSSVKEEDHGKAIAVDIGDDDEYDWNFALKLLP